MAHGVATGTDSTAAVYQSRRLCMDPTYNLSLAPPDYSPTPYALRISRHELKLNVLYGVPRERQ